MLHLFCEPSTPPVRPMPQVVVHRNPVQRGCIGNWAFCLRWLVEHSPASHFLICEDDVSYCRGARLGLERALQEYEDFGFVSLYTPKRHSQWMANMHGWVELTHGYDIWGTQAMCFTRKSAERLLCYERLQTDDQLRGPTDYIVMECFQGVKPCYYHRPSLADHVGKISTIQHNWYDDHTGLEFDPSFCPASATQPPSDLPLSEALVAEHVETKTWSMAVVSVYQENIPQEILSAQADIISSWLPTGCTFEQRRVSHHALGLDDYFAQELLHDAYLIFDIDCIPLQEWAMSWFLENAMAGTLVGCAQRANHLNNGRHVYAGPCALAFSRETYDRLGRPSFRGTERSDVAEEITRGCEELNIPLTLLWPTHVELPKWSLLPGVEFGLGTTYGDLVYHAFEISKGATKDRFLSRSSEVLGYRPSDSSRSYAAGSDASRESSKASLHDHTMTTSAMFHEKWYPPNELARLEAAAGLVQGLPGVVIEIGCWEGRSTAVIANRCWPDTLYAVDNWEGNVSERPDHETVIALRSRDVFRDFQHNMAVLTRANIKVCREECTTFLRSFDRSIRFCHFDAAHDYASVRLAIELILPRLIKGGIIIGHDYQTAHIGRDDLQGGVQRAVRDVIPDHMAAGNMWWYVHRDSNLGR